MADVHVLSIVLSFGTLGFVGVLAYLSARATEQLKDDPMHKRSSLCVTKRGKAKLDNAA
ncbi:MAG: hypothetical protein AAF965_04550 [Pseudomonadota bacterium]